MALLSCTGLYLTPLHSTMAVRHPTWLYYPLPWLYLALLHSSWLYYKLYIDSTTAHYTMALTVSTSLYFTLLYKLYNGYTWLYLTLLHYIPGLNLATMAPPGSTWLYYTLSWLHLALLDSTTLYHGSTWLYFTLIDSPKLYNGFTWLYLTLLHYHGST